MAVDQREEDNTSKASASERMLRRIPPNNMERLRLCAVTLTYRRQALRPAGTHRLCPWGSIDTLFLI